MLHFGNLWAAEGSILACHGQHFSDVASSEDLRVADESILMPTWDAHAPFWYAGKQNRSHLETKMESRMDPKRRLIKK